MEGPLDLAELESRLRYRFRNPELLGEALRDASFVNETRPGEQDWNGRLAFLGDAIVEVHVRLALREKRGSATRDALSKAADLLVTDTHLAEVAGHLGLSPHVHLGRGSHQSEGRENPTILARAFEAVIGAVAIDGGSEVAIAVCARWLTIPTLTGSTN